MPWLSRWEPEDSRFWRTEGSRRAWLTLAVTTFSLVASFATWFVFSAVVVRLPGIGFRFDTRQLFWLAAMPGLSAGILRAIHTFLVPIYGTRVTVTVATLLKLIPMLWLGLAIQDPATPYWHFLTMAFLCGMGGGDFSSFMPSTSMFFPKRLQGTAMGIQAGVGNFGVSLTQFVTPWIIGFPLLAACGSPQSLVKGAESQAVWLQNAALWYVPYLVLAGILCAVSLRSIGGKRPSVGEMLRNMTDNKHAWFCVITYVMTFGSFSGFSAAFPLMIKSIYGGFEGAPDPLKYAFLGPLVGSTARVVGGPLADRFGGSVWTQLSGVGLIGGCLALIFGGYLQPTSIDQFSGFLWVMLWIFLMAGIGNFATFRQYPIIFAFSPRQGAQLLGWTGAMAAFGPFVFSTLIGESISRTGSAIPFFWGALAFYAVASSINYWYYTRRAGERYDFGTWRGTWWDQAKATWPKDGK
ncbi:MAG: NarK/NasA family nitrate transporter [Planctomycetes bacterium]|nr:NarK/NasA family nitrate transporter [Planctomycetota bacterium]